MGCASVAPMTLLILSFALQLCAVLLFGIAVHTSVKHELSQGHAFVLATVAAALTLSGTHCPLIHVTICSFRFLLLHSVGQSLHRA